jgi:hypothetical protein
VSPLPLDELYLLPYIDLIMSLPTFLITSTYQDAHLFFLCPSSTTDSILDKSHHRSNVEYIPNRYSTTPIAILPHSKLYPMSSSIFVTPSMLSYFLWISPKFSPQFTYSTKTTDPLDCGSSATQTALPIFSQMATIIDGFEWSY